MTLDRIDFPFFAHLMDEKSRSPPSLWKMNKCTFFFFWYKTREGAGNKEAERNLSCFSYAQKRAAEAKFLEWRARRTQLITLYPFLASRKSSASWCYWSVKVKWFIRGSVVVAWRESRVLLWVPRFLSAFDGYGGVVRIFAWLNFRETCC